MQKSVGQRIVEALKIDKVFIGLVIIVAGIVGIATMMLAAAGIWASITAMGY